MRAEQSAATWSARVAHRTCLGALVNFREWFEAADGLILRTAKALDELDWCRLVWAEMNGIDPHLQHPGNDQQGSANPRGMQSSGACLEVGLLTNKNRLQHSAKEPEAEGVQVHAKPRWKQHLEANPGIVTEAVRQLRSTRRITFQRRNPQNKVIRGITPSFTPRSTQNQRIKRHVHHKFFLHHPAQHGSSRNTQHRTNVSLAIHSGVIEEDIDLVAGDSNGASWHRKLTCTAIRQHPSRSAQKRQAPCAAWPQTVVGPWRHSA